MDYRHFRYASLKYIQNNPGYSDIEYDPSSYLNSSGHVGADILNLLLLYELSTFFTFVVFYYLELLLFVFLPDIQLFLSVFQRLFLMENK